MRIDELVIDAFGVLDNLRVAGLGDQPIVVVLGPNESGKTTLFEFWCTILFGFKPASRDKHDYLPWRPDAKSLGGQARLILGDGRPATVKRKLQSSPSGRVTYEDGTRENVVNNLLPFLEGLSRELYTHAYALTLAELAALQARSEPGKKPGTSEKEAWRHVEQCLLSGEAPGRYRPFQEVLDTLQSDANKLWRPDRRPGPEHLKLEKNVETLKGRRAKTVDRRNQHREVLRLLDRCPAEIQAAEGRVVCAGHERDRIRELGKLLQRRQRIDEHRREANELDGAETWPADPAEHFSNLEARATQAKEQLQKRESAQRDATGTEVTAQHEAVLGLEDELQEFVRERSQDDEDRPRIAALQEQEATFKRLRAAVEQPEHADRTAWRAPLGIAAALGGVAVLGLILGLWPWPVILLPVLGSVAWAWWRRHATEERRRHAAEERRRERERLDDDVDKVRAEIARLELLVSGRRQRAAGLAERLDDRPLVDTDDLWERVETWQRLLTQAHEAKAGQAARLTLLATLEAEVADAQKVLDTAQGELDEFMERLGALAPDGNAQTGIDCIKEAHSLRTLADADERDVKPQALAEAKQRRDEHGEDLGLAGAATQLQAAETSARDARATQTRLEGECERLVESGVMLDGIDGEIQAIEERQLDLRRARDRLALLAAAIRLGDERYRDEHQPGVLERASEYLADITGGSTDRLTVDRVDDVPRLHLHYAQRDKPVAVDAPLSRGIREQVYLAFRLALVDALDGDGDSASTERLPLVLDEVIVNWDRTRRAAFIRKVLPRIAERRQVLVLTCHEHVARELEEGGARVERLTGA